MRYILSDSVRKAILPIILVIGLISIVMVSGCIGQQQQSSANNGLAIKNLQISPPADQIKSRAGEFVYITFEIENVGGSKARNVNIELTGVNWVDDKSITTKAPIPVMNPPTNIGSGDVRTIEFILPMPALPEGRTVTYPITIRITYDYDTGGTIIIPGMSEQRYETDVQLGNTERVQESSQITVQQTQGTPLSIGITGPDKFVVERSDFTDRVYHITVSNVGDGLPITTSPITGQPDDGLVFFTSWVNGPGAYFTDCMGLKGSQLAGDPFYTSANGIRSVGDMFSFFYSNKNWDIGLRNVNGEWTGIVTYTKGGTTISLGGSEVDSYVHYPTILSSQYLYRDFPAIKLLPESGGKIQRPCTVRIENFPRGWMDRSGDTIAMYFDMLYTYYIEQKFDLTFTAPIIRQ